MCEETVLCSTDGSPHENGRTYVVESAPEDVAAPMRAWLCPRQRAHHRLLERYQLTRPSGLDGCPGYRGSDWRSLSATVDDPPPSSSCSSSSRVRARRAAGAAGQGLPPHDLTRRNVHGAVDEDEPD